MTQEDNSSETATDGPTPQPVRNEPPTVETGPQQSGRSLSDPVRYVLSLLFLAAAGLGCYGLILLAKPTESQEPTSLVPRVVLQDVDKYAGPINLLVSGTVVAHLEINVAAEVSGRVLKKYPECLAGNFVKKGTPLILIDPESYQLEMNTIKAEMNQADKRIAEIDKQIGGENKNLKLARGDLEIQRREFERLKRLRTAISDSELDQARRSLNTAQTQVTARRNAIEGLGASRETQVAAKELTEQRLSRAMLELRRTKIVAPADGVIVSESVQQDAFVRQGERVLQFENTDVSEVRCNLTTTDLDWIRLNSRDREAAKSIYQLPKTDVKIYDTAEPDVVWDGVLERFSGIGRDPVTKTTPCRIIVPTPIVQAKTGPRALVRGMFVKCKIEVQTSAGDLSNDLITFSERALQPNGDVWYVREKKLMKAVVNIVDRVEWEDEDSQIQVSIIARVKEGDLEPGDTVVISPLSQPTIGTEIIIAGDKTMADSDPPDPDTVATKEDEQAAQKN